MSQNQPDGYLALPASGQGRPVLVLHAWWGLNEIFKQFCDRLGEAGFLAFALDLYHGKVTDQIAEAEVLGSALDQRFGEAKTEILEAVEFLKGHPASDGSSVSVVGFSLGAAYALDLASSAADDVRSVVLFYGTSPADFSKSKAEYLGHFAADDPYEAKENVDWLENEIKDAGRGVTFYTYPDTGHWFFESNRPDAYNEGAASLAWERTLAFLKR